MLCASIPLDAPGDQTLSLNIVVPALTSYLASPALWHALYFIATAAEHDASEKAAMYKRVLERGIKEGTLHLHLPGSKTQTFGDHGPEASWIIKRRGIMAKVALYPAFQLGETYINGDWEAEPGKLYDLLYILSANIPEKSPPRLLYPLLLLRQQWNNVTASMSNASSHYNLDHTLFKTFLDREMFYSCAYFENLNTELEAAQQAKSRHIAKKLILEPGQRVLDIGCGWGSLAFYLAQHHDVEVVGITLAREQRDYANWRAQVLGIRNVRFELADYREHREHYDRVVSVGMFEHVGKPYYSRYFREIKRLLNARGVALVHSIGRSGPPLLTNPWIRRYIFPGGAIPSLSEMTHASEQEHLLVTDIEILRLHYAYTLRVWYDRFQLHRQEVAERMGEKFCRMWEFYLAISEVSFRRGELVVFQQQLATELGLVPITRDYLYETDRANAKEWSRAGTA